MTKTLYIEGMMCPHCEAHVKKALEALDGVSEADAVAFMKSYDLCPSYIGEYLDNGKPYRNYRFDVVLEDSLGNGVADMTLSIDIIDGVIHDARAYYYER